MLCISSPIASWCDRMQLLILGQLTITCRRQFAKQVFPRFRMPLLAREYIIACKDQFTRVQNNSLLFVRLVLLSYLTHGWGQLLYITPINNMETFLSAVAI